MVEAAKVAAGKVEADKAAAGRVAVGAAAAISPALALVATASAQAAGTKSRMWLDNAVWTAFVLNVERG